MSEIEQLIKESDELIKNLTWTETQAREHLLEICNKKSRYHLDIDEWAKYLKALKSEVICIKCFPSYKEKDLITMAMTEYTRLGWDRKKQATELLKTYKCMLLKSLRPSDLKAWVNYLHSLPVEVHKY